MEVIPAFKPHAQSAELMKPTHRPFGHPAVDAQSAPVRRVAFRQVRLDPASAKLLPMGFRIIRAVALDRFRMLLRPSWFAGDRRIRGNEWQQLRDIMTVGHGQNPIQRNPVSIGQQVMLIPRFPPISRVGTGFFASADGSHRRTVDRGSRPVDVIGLA